MRRRHRKSGAAHPRRLRSFAAVATLATLLAACAPGSRIARPHADGTAQGGDARSSPHASAAAPVLDAGVADPVVTVSVDPMDTWARIRAGLAFAHCEGDARRERWLSEYGTHAERLAYLLRRNRAAIDMVLEEFEHAGLPTEFVLLPIVESDYVPVPPRAGGVAGIWQLQPGTARELGLRIDREYDGRLDLIASTRTAARLIAVLRDRYPQDWRLVDMAYNAGHARVARAVAAFERRGEGIDLDRLALNPTTHHHVARLEALACAVREPERHGLALPDIDPAHALEPVTVDAGVDFELLARLSSLPLDRLRALNPAFLRARVPAREPHVLLFPTDAAARLRAGLDEIPPSTRARFAYGTLPRTADWAELERASGVPRTRLAALNGASASEPIAARRRLYLPDAALAATGARSEGRRVAAASAQPGPGSDTVEVRAGDSLWTLARISGTTVAELCEINGLDPRAHLRPGQVLRLRPAPAAAAVAVEPALR